MPFAFLPYSDACRVVAAIFQMLKSIEQDGRRLRPADIAHNSAHTITSALDLIIIRKEVSRYAKKQGKRMHAFPQFVKKLG